MDIQLTPELRTSLNFTLSSPDLPVVFFSPSWGFTSAPTVVELRLENFHPANMPTGPTSAAHIEYVQGVLGITVRPADSEGTERPAGTLLTPQELTLVQNLDASFTVLCRVELPAVSRSQAGGHSVEVAPVLPHGATCLLPQAYGGVHYRDACNLNTWLRLPGCGYMVATHHTWLRLPGTPRGAGIPLCHCGAGGSGPVLAHAQLQLPLPAPSGDRLRGAC